MASDHDSCEASSSSAPLCSLERAKLFVWRAARCAGIGALFLALGSCSEASDPDDERPGDILLVTVDTLRSDHVSLYGYERNTTPRLDEFFGSGMVFERAYATEASTSPSVVSMLSGQLPQEHGVRLFFQLVPEDVQLIPELLPRGYQSAAIVSNTVLTDEAMGMASRFDHFDDNVDQRESEKRTMFERDAESTTNAALAWLATERDVHRPLFMWVHYIDPHGPYRPPEAWEQSYEHEGSTAVDSERIPRYVRLEGVKDGLKYVDLYDEEIAYADQQVGRLLDGFRSLSDWERALVMFTSDHGESMMDHERWFAHSYQVYEEIAHVPLMLRAPGIGQQRVADLVSGVDVAATALAFSGAQLPASMTGLDLLGRYGPQSSSSNRERDAIFVEATRKGQQWRAALSGSHKWMLQVQGPEAQIVERRLYDLDQDPREQRPQMFNSANERETLAALPLGLLDQLESSIASDPDPSGVPTQYSKGMALDAPKVAPGATAEQLEALRGLGYTD